MRPSFAESFRSDSSIQIEDSRPQRFAAPQVELVAERQAGLSRDYKNSEILKVKSKFTGRGEDSKGYRILNQENKYSNVGPLLVDADTQTQKEAKKVEFKEIQVCDEDAEFGDEAKSKREKNQDGDEASSDYSGNDGQLRQRDKTTF